VTGRRRQILDVLREQGVEPDEAARLVAEHRILVAGRPVLGLGSLVGAHDPVEIRDSGSWRPRGWRKLEAARAAWQSEVDGAVCLDLGSSTGGFVMALRDRGARRVVAVERGRHQLDVSLRSDPRVEVHEGTDLRRFAWPYPEQPEVVTADLSWISLCEVMCHLARLASGAREVIVLIKPQFELDGRARDRGVVRDDARRAAAIARVEECARAAGATVRDLLPTPVRGARGNQEYFLRMRFDCVSRG